MAILATLSVEVITDPREIQRLNSLMGKPFLRIYVPHSAEPLDITLDVGELLGGTARLAKELHEAGGRVSER